MPVNPSIADRDSGTSRAVTIFTATFNRAHTLERLARSIERQTFDVDFEWLIVDDGSTDETEELIARIAPTMPFPVRYFRKSNGGKHTAFNRGVELAHGAFMLTIDSDDELHPEGLKNAMNAWQSIPTDERYRFQGVAGLCTDQQGKIIGDPFPKDAFDSNTPEVAFRYRVRGDKSGMHLTSIFRKHPFPERPGMKFVPEGRIWMEMSNIYLTRYVNAPFAIVHHDAGSNLSTLHRNLKVSGDWEYHGYMLSEQMRWARFAIGEYVKSAIVYQRACRNLRTSRMDPGPVRRFGWPARLLMAATWPLVFVPYAWLSRQSPLWGTASNGE